MQFYGDYRLPIHSNKGTFLDNDGSNYKSFMASSLLPISIDLWAISVNDIPFSFSNLYLIITNWILDLITNRIFILIMILHFTTGPIGKNPHSKGLIFFQVVINLKRKVVLTIPQENVQ